jgi:hypothetical protein
VQKLSVTSGGISFAIRLIPKGGTIWIAGAHRDDGKRKNEGSIPLTCFFIARILSKIAQVNVLRYWLKTRVRFDIALQKNRYVLLATTIFNVVAVP